MREASRFVVDASVAVKWHLDDEPQIEQALSILHAYQEGQIRLLVPDHVRYEIAHALRRAARRGRVSPQQGEAALRAFLALRLPTIGTDQLILGGFSQALRFGCSLYDGLYLALAESTRCPFIYADHRLRNTLAGRFPLAVWIEDYSL